MSALEATGLGVRLGGQSVLAGIDLAVAEGEVVGLVGANGAGKTTLLRALAGLLPAAAGEVRLDSRPLAAWARSDLARRLAYLPQNAPCHWPITAADAVMLGRLPRLRPWMRPSARDERAVTGALREVDAARFAARRVDTLSEGERARVMLARALAAEPAILLADEPVAGLDPGHQLKVMTHLRRLAAAGRSTVVTLHELTLAARFCDRLVLLHAGRVLAAGEPRAVLSADNLSAAFAIRAELGSREGELYVVPWEATGEHTDA